MLKKLSILGTVALLSACQTTGEPVTESPRVSSSNVENSVYMKDTQPRGLGSRRWGTWNQDMPTSPWVYNLTNIVPARSGELSQRFELRNGDCTTNPAPGDNHPNDWGCHNDRERAEIMHTQWRPGQDKWIGFSVRVDDDWTKAQRNHCTHIFQIKQYEDGVRQGKLPENDNGGHYVGRHAVMMGQICGGKFGIRLSWTDFEDSKFNGWEHTEHIMFGNIDNINGEWNDIVMRWDTSDYRNGNSKLEFYLNGKKAGEWENITSKFFPSTYAFKYGIYRGNMKKNNGPNFKIGTQVLYFDEIRTGRSFDAVNPATNRTID